MSNEDSKKSTLPRNQRTASAKTKIMDYLARRSHSRQELFTKLSRDFSREEVEEALEHAENSGWLEAPSELSAKVQVELDRKGKGALYLKAYLRKKGLPSITIDRTKEIQKALRVIEKVLKIGHPFPKDNFPAIIRTLKNRGFDDDTIRSVLKNEL